MRVSRRDFLKSVGLSAAALGLGAADLGRLERALADPAAPPVIWLQGAGCTGCSVSFLNRVSSSPPETVAEVLIDSVNLVYHPTVMALAGEDATWEASKVAQQGGHVLVVEGAVPLKYGGHACSVGHWNGHEVTCEQAVIELASTAAYVMCVGNCASWGGIPAAVTSVTEAVGVSEVLGQPTLNIAGCPPHPDWMIWPIAQILMGNVPIDVDEYGRPLAIYGQTIHDLCPYRNQDGPKGKGGPGRCLEDIGCRGEEASGTCPVSLWNGGTSWCVDADAPCIGCTNPEFPRSPLLVPSGDDG